MAITVTPEAAQHNFYQYVRQLDTGALDKLTIADGGVNLAVMVPWATYAAADPNNAGAVAYDVVAAYSGAPSVHTASLYKLIKVLRDRQAFADPQAATGSLAIPAGGGAVIIDGEAFTLTNTAGVATKFEFDVGGGGVTAAVAATGSIAIPAGGGAAIVDGEAFALINAAGVRTTFEFDNDATTATGNIPITFVGNENQAALSALVEGAITAAAIDITAVDNGNSVGLTQGTAGAAGNTTITETVVDAGFVVTSFTGGVDAATAVVIVGNENQAALSALVEGAITTAAIGITAVDGGTAVALTQDVAGTAGNTTITETVVDAGFVATSFTGGTDVAVAGGVIALKNSKNDTTAKVALMAQDLATAIGV